MKEVSNWDELFRIINSVSARPISEGVQEIIKNKFEEPKLKEIRN